MNSKPSTSRRFGRRLAVSTALLIGCVTTALLAVGGDKAMYVGGTLTGLKEKTEGRLVTTSESVLTFAHEHGDPCEGLSFMLPQ